MSYSSHTNFSSEDLNSTDDFTLLLNDDIADIDHILVHLQMGAEEFKALTSDLSIH